MTTDRIKVIVVVYGLDGRVKRHFIRESEYDLDKTEQYVKSLGKTIFRCDTRPMEVVGTDEVVTMVMPHGIDGIGSDLVNSAWAGTWPEGRIGGDVSIRYYIVREVVVHDEPLPERNPLHEAALNLDDVKDAFGKTIEFFHDGGSVRRYLVASRPFKGRLGWKIRYMTEGHSGFPENPIIEEVYLASLGIVPGGEDDWWSATNYCLWAGVR